MEILCSFRLVLEGKTGKEISESSRLEFLEKFLANNFTLSDAEDNTSGLLNRGDIAEDNTFGPLNRGGIADLPLLRTQEHKYFRLREQTTKTNRCVVYFPM